MKYYVYGRKTENVDLVPDNYFKIDYETLNMILMAIKEGQCLYGNELKVKIYDDFKKYAIYPVELSYAAIDFYDLVYIGEVVYKPLDNDILPSLILNINVELRVDTVEGRFDYMNLNILIKKIEQWGKYCGLCGHGTDYEQMRKTLEKIAELSIGILKGDVPNIIDGVGDVFVTVVIGNMLSLDKNKVDITDVVDEIRENENLDDYDRGYQAKSVSGLFHSVYRLENDSIVRIDYYHKDSIYEILHNLLIVCAVWGLDLEDCVALVCEKIATPKENDLKDFEMIEV